MARATLGSGPYRVAVLAGGTSAERAVSLDSGANVAAALQQAGHAVALVDPAETPLERVAWPRFDVAFLALHGTGGEDGQTQEALDGIGVAYTGSDAIASKLAFSKSAAKERFALCGVPTPASALIHETDDAAHIHRAARHVGYPLVVKPDAQGSSLGVALVDSPDGLPEALAGCFHYGAFGLLESFVDGSEWTVGLIDDLVLPPIRIETPRTFYDYEAKYHDDATRYEFESDLPPAIVRAIQDAGFRAGRGIGTSGPARVDLRVDRFGRAWVLEVNTIPGLTDHSLIPKAAARAGLSFSGLCERAVRSALDRGATKIRRSA